MKHTVQIHIIAVGKLNPGVENNLFLHYKKRIRWPVEVRELDERKLPAQKRREQLGKSLLSAVPYGANLVVLDQRGQNLTSKDLAQHIGKLRDEGKPKIAFLIGGADGLSDNVRDHASLLLAFGRTTWPHLMIRGMLTEQLYRVQQILSGHPYHRDR